MLLSLAWAADRAGVEMEPLRNKAGRANAASIAKSLAEPDTTPEFIERVTQLMQESLAIGALGMLLALLLGIPLALLGARIPELSDPPAQHPGGRAMRRGLRWLARASLATLRSIPDIVWAFLFVRILGLGPGPAVIAIGLSFAGIIGKLYAELIEAVDPVPVRALRAAGCSWLRTLSSSVLPQVSSA